MYRIPGPPGFGCSETAESPSSKIAGMFNGFLALATGGLPAAPFFSTCSGAEGDFGGTTGWSFLDLTTSGSLLVGDFEREEELAAKGELLPGGFAFFVSPGAPGFPAFPESRFDAAPFPPFFFSGFIAIHAAHLHTLSSLWLLWKESF